MIFENSRTIISLRIKLFIATVLFLTFIILTYIAGKIKYPVLGMSDTLWTVILAIIYIGFVFMPVVLNYQYISFSDEGSNIIIRYFPAGIMGGKKSSVEIDKKAFSGYKIEKKLFGLNQSVVLYQKLREGIAKYPPVYISVLTKEEKSKLMKTLNKYAPRIKDES